MIHRLLASFVNRDMLMRFHWGMAVRHLYCHGSGTAPAPSSNVDQPTHHATGLIVPDEPMDIDNDPPSHGSRQGLLGTPFISGEETDSDDPMYDRRNTDSDGNTTDWDSEGEGAGWRTPQDSDDQDL